jgi:hypothetical protein
VWVENITDILVFDIWVVMERNRWEAIIDQHNQPKSVSIPAKEAVDAAGKLT